MFLPNVPENLPHASGSTLEIDRSRLLIINFDFVNWVAKNTYLIRKIIEAFSRLIGVSKIDLSILTQSTEGLLNMLQSSLRSVGIDIEVPTSSRLGQRINNTQWQVWVRTTTGTAFDENTARMLAGMLGSSLNWTNSYFSPVYRFANTSDSDSLVSPLPHLLVIKGPPNKKREIIETLEKYRLVEAPTSKYFASGFFCFILKSPQGENVYDLPQLLRQQESSLVEDAWFDYTPAKAPTAAGFSPTDPLFKDQWNLEKIEAVAGWNLTNPPILGENVTVAVIDYGCDLSHPDFLPDGFSSPGTTFTYGTQFGDGSFEPGEPHGTKCAGLIGARFNDKGIAGLAGRCKILPIRLATFEPSALHAAIGYALDHKAKVINMSLEPGNSNLYGTPDVKARLEEAFLPPNNVVLCAATGNGNSSKIYHPAAHPRVIACGATDSDDARVQPNEKKGIDWGSNYGTDPTLDPFSGGFLSVMAPGIGITTTTNQRSDNPPSGTFVSDWGGTSAAAPQVAALAALLISKAPALTSQQVRDIIETTADKVPQINDYKISKPNGGWNSECGYGRINVRKALEKAALAISPPAPPINLNLG